MDQVVTVITGKGKAAAWKRTFLMDDIGTMLVAIRNVAEDEDRLVEQAQADGVGVYDYLEHAFAPVAWLARVVPSHARHLARAVSCLRAGLMLRQTMGRHTGAGAVADNQADGLVGSQIEAGHTPQGFALAGAGFGQARSEAHRAWTSRVSAIRSAGHGGTQP
jgi:hypothetical protein